MIRKDIPLASLMKSDKPKYKVADDEMEALKETLDELLNEAEPDFYAELKDAAWNILHENPGYEFDEWMQTLIEAYPSEVVDAFGACPPETFAYLADMWDTWDYEDETTGECHAFKVWAEYFATERSIELYDLLAEAKSEIKRFERQKNFRR